MRRTNKMLLALIIVAMLLLGIGYAAVQNITLNITGTATADPSQANFKVMFSGTPEVSDSTYVTAAITDETNATINVEGLTESGDMVYAIYTVQNTSTDLSADLSVSTTNSNSEYFTLTSELGKPSLLTGEATTLIVTVELTKTPIAESVSATIGVQLEAMPVQPGEEGTSEGTNDFSQAPNDINEYGFYYDKPYSATLDERELGVIFYENTSCDFYSPDGTVQEIPAGLIIYDSFCIDASAIDLGILTVSPDGRQINIDGLVLELDEDFLETRKNGLYFTYNIDTEKYVLCEKMPSEVSAGDLYIFGDYIYGYGNSFLNRETWRVQLFDIDAENIDELSELLGIDLEGYGTDRYQTSYGPILSNINGKPITNMYSTFEGCTSLTIAPEIPYAVTYMAGAFKNCKSLTTAPVIPYGVTSLGGADYGENEGAFEGCTSLTIAPDIPDTVNDMTATFKNCTSLITAPGIPDSVAEMIETFSGCTALESAPEIPSSVWDMTKTFAGCTSLNGVIAINVVEGTIYDECFKDVDMSKVVLAGTASTEMLDLLGSTGNNYMPIE